MRMQACFSHAGWQVSDANDCHRLVQEKIVCNMFLILYTILGCHTANAHTAAGSRYCTVSGHQQHDPEPADHFMLPACRRLRMLAAFHLAAPGLDTLQQL